MRVKPTKDLCQEQEQVTSYGDLLALSQPPPGIIFDEEQPKPSYYEALSHPMDSNFICNFAHSISTSHPFDTDPSFPSFMASLQERLDALNK